MPNLGFSELVVILMIVVLVFGASRLPQIGEGVGRAIKNFKKGMASDDRIKVVEEGTTPAVPPAKAAERAPDEAEILEPKS